MSDTIKYIATSERLVSINTSKIGFSDDTNIIGDPTCWFHHMNGNTYSYWCKGIKVGQARDIRAVANVNSFDVEGRTLALPATE